MSLKLYIHSTMNDLWFIWYHFMVSLILLITLVLYKVKGVLFDRFPSSPYLGLLMGSNPPGHPLQWGYTRWHDIIDMMCKFCTFYIFTGAPCHPRKILLWATASLSLNPPGPFLLSFETHTHRGQSLASKQKVKPFIQHYWSIYRVKGFAQVPNRIFLTCGVTYCNPIPLFCSLTLDFGEMLSRWQTHYAAGINVRQYLAGSPFDFKVALLVKAKSGRMIRQHIVLCWLV